MKKRFIVGDCFERFNRHANVLSLDCFKKLDIKATETLSYQYIIGQGISLSDLENIKSSNLPLYNLILNPQVVEKNPEIAHKRKIENCHIARPVKISDTDYQLDVVVDSKCCDISDHITGEHINGVVLIEAARQAFIAVTEIFFLDKNEKVYFILKKLDCEFNSFLFPLTIQMKYKILHFEKKGLAQFDFEVETMFFHHEKNESTIIRGAFSVYPKLLMEQIENELAESAVDIFYNTVDDELLHAKAVDV
jgi:hypothetical protein